MKNRWMIVLLVFSLTVNIAAVATLVYFWRHDHQPAPMPPLSVDERDLINRPIPPWRDMNLPPNVKREIFELRRQFRFEIEDRKKSVDDARMLVMQQLSRPTIDQDSLDIVLRMLADQQMKMEKMTVDHLLTMRSHLNKEQWQIVLRLMERDRRGMQRQPLARRGRPFELQKPE